jgi:hypothetical protein
VDDQCHVPAALPPGKRPGTHFIGGWVNPRTGLEGCGKSHPRRDSIPGFSSPWRAAVDYAIPAYIHLLLLTKSDRKSLKVVTKEGEAISSLRRHDETSSGAMSLYPLTRGGTAVQGKAAAASSGSLRYLIKHYACCLLSWRYNPLWLYFPQPSSGL